MKKPSRKEFRMFKVTLNPEVKGAAFENFMKKQVLENTITFRDGHSSQDELYSQKGGGTGGNSYIWIISRTPSGGGAFTHNTDASAAFKALKDKVEVFGLITPL